MSSQKVIPKEESLHDSWVELHFDSSSEHSDDTPALSDITDLEKMLLEAQRESSSSSRTSSHCSSPRRVQTPPLITAQGEVVPESKQEAEAVTRICDWSSRPENLPPAPFIIKRPKRTRMSSKHSEDTQALSDITDLEKMLLEAQGESSSSSRTSSHCSSPRRVLTPPLITAQVEVVPESKQETEAVTRICDWSSRPENMLHTAFIIKRPKRTRMSSKQSEDTPALSDITDLEKMLLEAQGESSSSSRTSSHCSSPRRVQTPPLITAQGEVVPESQQEAEAITRICDWSSRPENLPPTAFIIKRPKRTRMCSKDTDKNDTEMNKDLLKLLLPSLVLTHILMLGLGICIGRRLATQCSAF